MVHRIDRLSRSLLDFACLLDLFEQHAVTFVSVTPAFSTTTSMGRPALNVLLSLAQCERELAGERIRDKVAEPLASSGQVSAGKPHGNLGRDRLISMGVVSAAPYGGRWAMISSLMKLGLETALLTIEAQTVVGIRLAQLATGRGTIGESQLMVTEKMLAFVEAAGTVAMGGSPHKVVSGYRKRVRANVRRLRR